MRLTICSLKRQRDGLPRQAGDFSSSFQRKLKLVLQEGLAQAQSGALAIENLEHTQVAEQTRSGKRKSQNRRPVQTGGLIYASEARQVVTGTGTMVTDGFLLGLVWFQDTSLVAVALLWMQAVSFET